MRRHVAVPSSVPALLLAAGVLSCGGGTEPPGGGGPDVAVTAFSVDSLTEGQPVTITGRGFSATAASNTVTIGGAPATVTAASTTSLTVTVPTACLPLGPAAVTVKVGAVTSTPVNHPARVAQFFSLAVGQQAILSDPAAYCLQFRASAQPESYLVGILNTQENAEATVSAVVAASSAAGASPFIASAPPATPSMLQGAMQSLDPYARSPQARRLRDHRAAEGRLRASEAALLRGKHVPASLRSARGAVSARMAPGVSLLPSAPAVGDTVPVRIIKLANVSCATFDTVKAVVRVIGAKGIWMEDAANDLFLGAGDLQALSDRLDNQIYTTDVGLWGAPTDLDNNQRLVVLVTRRVNASAGVLGFVFSGDLFPDTGDPNSACGASNVGEIYYAKAPSADYTTAQTLLDAPLLIAHEFTHVIQNGRRIYGTQTVDMQAWEKEGGATLSEEINGLVAEGHLADQELGLAVAASDFDNTRIQWYIDKWVDMGLFFGWAPSIGPDSRNPVAPENCAFVWSSLVAGQGDACVGARSMYGNPSLLIRWLADQVGPTYTGPGGNGTNAFLQDLIGSNDFGLANLANRSGIDVPTMLSQYYAMLYVDGRVANPAARLQLPTWNIFNIYEGTTGQSRLRPALRLQPDSSGFTTFSAPYAIRGASTSYTRFFGTRGAASIRARAANGTALLPATTRMWVVRLQ